MTEMRSPIQYEIVLLGTQGVVVFWPGVDILYVCKADRHYDLSLMLLFMIVLQIDCELFNREIHQMQRTYYLAQLRITETAEFSLYAPCSSDLHSS